MLIAGEPPKITKNAIKKLYCLLDAISGYKQLPMLSRHDFHFLEKWLSRYHPEQIKARLILKYLCW